MKIFGYDTQHIFDKITGKLKGWGEALITALPNLIVAILLIVGFIFLAKILKKYSNKYLQKVNIKPTVSSFLSQLIYLGVIVVGIMLALSALDLTKTVSSILAGLGILGLALGFAFQDTAANFMSGVFITFNQPYMLGDIIESKGGYEGVVIDINLRVTKIRTFNGPIVHVPNRQLFQESFTNYTQFEKRRLQIPCGISYGEDLERVQKIALDAMQDLPSRLKDEDVTFFWNDFGDSSINFTLNIWVEYKQSKLNYIGAKNEAMIALKKAFDANDIMIPFPIRTLDFGIKGGVSLNEEVKTLQSPSKENSQEGHSDLN
jgi:small conductance mechanosensitive channel